MNSIKDVIIEFIDSEDKELELPMIPINDIDNIFKDLNFVDNNNWSFGDWRCVFWKSYTKSNLTVEFCGSLYYGSFLLIKNNK